MIASTLWLQETLTLGEGQTLNLAEIWEAGGWMMWPLGAALAIGILIILWKLVDLQLKGGKNKNVLREADEQIAAGHLDEALELCTESGAPAGNVLSAGLSRYNEGTDRATQAVENAGAIEVAGLEKGLVWLATLSNVAPLLGFLGTVIGMIMAFQAIEIAGEVEATLVAGGIKVALITTATGLTIAIPINIFHNYFVTKIDRLVIDMEESAQRLIDALHERVAA
ncbi:MAG: MotA/TolQ/ExbB proton channel family protein [Gemmatimonadales bacterium]|uniref:MotA/TolQ/ExbB proton channel family protein n=1 Tax=Candidatus Palauibacter polyketidifaciens TaxID=3056740 RepID=UPI00138653C2|nr:MotA/TolQ/ExbB proton channel family protein [Candidatus Palauibacter polyketidifaciens]MXX68798.1 MotA/TolQ/ExbB proton channel family protein [Gemmatimonadales bacterium]MDE2719173.1 MotA/TolQ/ExbB proton channel family protein [Candidatus Palauibacter polyketidifaciens]MYE33847.1 MotA/TolQ/ExbB proton channel family protein [Gemmatimonadales bacterium]MYG20221.1 MotA/TolQ/ExbB proton channel family protein [Gemmatimonadales bacterium]MYH10331.1 MotA/TolQ/ExbB proton channel family protei